MVDAVVANFRRQFRGRDSQDNTAQNRPVDYAKLLEENRALKIQLRRANAQLALAKRNLKSLDAAKDEFISMAAHQLRTPLTTIKGYVSMILEGDAGHINNQQKEFLGYTYTGAERLVSLISDLLNVSRLNAGRFLIDKKLTDLGAVLADEVRQLSPHAAAKQLNIKLNLPNPPVPLVNIDENKTRQVIMNFIDNAVYYSRHGDIEVTLKADHDRVYVTVSDGGIGVPETAKPKLFTKFFRADNAQVARPDGTGLGLYLAKQVIEDQGGKLIFESQENVGSTFGFSLPLKASKK